MLLSFVTNINFHDFNVLGFGVCKTLINNNNDNFTIYVSFVMKPRPSRVNFSASSDGLSLVPLHLTPPCKPFKYP